MSMYFMTKKRNDKRFFLAFESRGDAHCHCAETSAIITMTISVMLMFLGFDVCVYSCPSISKIKNTTDFRKVVVIVSRIDNRRIIHVKAQQLDDSSRFFNDIIKSDCFSTDENQTTR